MIIGTKIIEGEAGAEVGNDMTRTGTEIVITVAVAELAVLVLIMTGNITETVALLHIEALVMEKAIHLVGYLLMKELLAGPGMSALHVLEALEPKLNIIHMDSLRVSGLELWQKQVCLLGYWSYMVAMVEYSM